MPGHSVGVPRSRYIVLANVFVRVAASSSWRANLLDCLLIPAWNVAGQAIICNFKLASEENLKIGGTVPFRALFDKSNSRQEAGRSTTGVREWIL